MLTRAEQIHSDILLPVCSIYQAAIRRLSTLESATSFEEHSAISAIAKLKEEQLVHKGQAKYLRTLQQVSTGLLTSTELLTVYRTVYRAIAEIIHLMAFWVTVWDKQNDVFRTVYLMENGAEVDVAQAEPLHRNPRSTGHGKAAVTGEPVLIRDFAQYMQGVKSSINLGSPKMAGATFYVPLKKQSEIFGVAVFQHKQKDSFSPRETEMLVGICTQLSAAMTNLDLREKLASNEQRYRYLISHMNDGFMVVNNDNIIEMTNDRMAHQIGLSKAEDLMGQSVFSFVDKTNMEIVKKATERRQQGLSETYEFTMRHVSGRPVVVSASVSPLFDDDQKVVGSYGLFRDITKQRMDEQQRQIFYEISRAANFTDSIQDLYQEIYRIINHLMDAKNFILALHNTEKHTIRYSFFRDEKDTQPEGEFPVRGMIGYVIKNNRPMLVNRRGVLAIYRAEGIEQIGTLPQYWIGIPMNIEDKVIGVLVVQTYDKQVVFTDRHRDVLAMIAGEIARVIERHRARRTIETSQARYQQIIDNAFDPIVTVGDDNIITIWNQAAERLFGFTVSELRGKTLKVIFSKKSLEGLMAIQEKIRTGADEKLGEVLELVARDKKGNTLEIALSVSLLVTDQNSQTTFVMRDITAAKKAERELMEAHSMKEMMLDIISHDLKNPAATISGMAELLIHDMPREEPLQVIRLASDNLLEVIGSASSLAQLMTEGQIDTELLDIAELIQSVVASFAIPLRAAGMKLDLRLKRPLMVIGNPILSEVFNNYISNAIKYAARGGKIVVEAIRRGKRLVTIDVRDFGKTIPEAERERVFYRHIQLAKGKKHGRGLGLAIVKRIAEAHQAEVGVKPNHPNGNIFYITLPLAQGGKLAQTE